MESSRVGPKPCSSCPWDRSGSSSFRLILPMAIAAQVQTLALVRLSFSKWSCCLSKPKANDELCGFLEGLEVANSTGKKAYEKPLAFRACCRGVVLSHRRRATRAERVRTIAIGDPAAATDSADGPAGGKACEGKR